MATARDGPADAAEVRMIGRCAGSTAAWGGEYRVDTKDRGRVYKSAAEIAVWDGAKGTLPRAAAFGSWAEEALRAMVLTQLLANLRSALARAVALGVVKSL